MSQSEHGQERLGADEPLIEEAFQESEGAAANCPETLLLFASGLLSALGDPLSGVLPAPGPPGYLKGKL